MTAVANRTGYSGTLVSTVCQAFMRQVIDELAAGNRMEFRGVGVFDVKRRQGRVDRNPKTRDPVTILARTVAVFTAGRNLKNRVVDVEPAH